MTDRPILFSGPMVRAILDGRKTQTRRVLKPQPAPGLVRESVMLGRDIPNTSHYAPGDRLWVKEALRFERCFDDFSPGNLPIGEIVARQYEADGSRKFWKFNHLPVGKLRPSMFMPRRFSRLTLTVTDVRVERVQDISEADAMAEGVIRDRVVVDVNCAVGAHHEEHADRYWNGTEPDDFEGHEYAEDAFAALWDDLNASRGYGWEANPWVVAITFTAEQRNIDEEEPDHATR